MKPSAELSLLPPRTCVFWSNHYVKNVVGVINSQVSRPSKAQGQHHRIVVLYFVDVRWWRSLPAPLTHAHVFCLSLFTAECFLPPTLHPPAHNINIPTQPQSTHQQTHIHSPLAIQHTSPPLSTTNTPCPTLLISLLMVATPLLPSSPPPLSTYTVY